MTKFKIGKKLDFGLRVLAVGLTCCVLGVQVACVGTVRTVRFLANCRKPP